MGSEPSHSGKGPWISDLGEGTRFVGFYMACEPNLEPFKETSRGHYLRLSLADRTGRIEARVWEDADKMASTLGSGRVVKAEGQVERFHDRLQVRVLRLRPAEPSEYDLRDLREATQRSTDRMLSEIDGAIADIQNPFLAALCHHFFDDPQLRSMLKEAPAAKRIHHWYVGGLLEHTYEIVLLSRPLLELYPEIDRDLLVAGVLLHDIGKLDELAWDLEVEYTDRGRLLGHVVMGAQRVSRAVEHLPGFPEDLALRLEHMILAHHGRYEWGSPRRPKTLEAVALHHLENLDGQVNRFLGLIRAAKRLGKSWTAYDHLLGRSLYAQNGPDLTPEEQGLTE